jgi:zinc transport system substrate-binding protein
MNSLSGKALLALVLCAFLCSSCMGGQQMKAEVSAPGPPLKVFCSFLPIYSYTANIAVTRKNIALEIVVPFKKGDPRTYTLPTGEVARVSGAQMLIVNGLGLEKSMIETLTKANPNLKIVDTSQGIEMLPPATAAEGACNPYIWMSPRCAIAQVRNIQKALYEVDPQGEAEVTAKTDDYVKMLEGLAARYAEEGSKCKDRKIATKGGFLDYLARDSGFQIAERFPEELDNITIPQDLKTKGIAALFCPSLHAAIQKKNDKSPAYYIDVLFAGDSYPNSYEKAMEKNLTIIKSALE